MSDPKNTPLTVHLEAIPDRAAGVLRAKGGVGGIVWYYDPCNRIMSPCVGTYATSAAFIGDLAVFFTDDNRTDPTQAVAALEGGIRHVKEQALRTKIRHALMCKDYQKAAELRSLLRDLTEDPTATEMPLAWPTVE